MPPALAWLAEAGLPDAACHVVDGDVIERQTDHQYHGAGDDRWEKVADSMNEEPHEDHAPPPMT